MNRKQTALVAAGVTGVGATFLTAFTATPDTITQLIVGGSAFLASVFVLGALLWTPWLRGLPQDRQRRVIWILAAGTGLVVACFLPMVRF